VFETLCEEADDMLVVEGIKNLLSSTAGTDETGPSEQPKLVRDGRFAEVQELGDISHAQFGARDRVENPHARRIAENLEGVSESGDRGVGQQSGFHSLNI
jgi:hypothetical protein